MDLEVTQNELCEYLSYMQHILYYPIPNHNCVVGHQLQQDIATVMEKCLNQLLEKLNAAKFLVVHSLLGTSINKYLACTLLVAENQLFTQHQIDQIICCAKTLKSKVHLMFYNLTNY